MVFLFFFSSFLSILVTYFFIGAKKVIYFSVLSGKKLNFGSNSSTRSFMIKR